MKNKELQAWLKSHDTDAEIKCWIQIEDDELSSSNMATIERDEIFKYQDKLDDIDYVENNEQNMRELFVLVDELLDELESRLQINPELIEELQTLQEKVDNGDTSDFVEMELPKESFWDKVDTFAQATKIRDYVESSDSLLRYVQERLPYADSYIEGSYLYIVGKGNESLPTSIISYVLDIDSKDIDDQAWEHRIYKIKLQEQI